MPPSPARGLSALGEELRVGCSTAACGPTIQAGKGRRGCGPPRQEAAALREALGLGFQQEGSGSSAWLPSRSPRQRSKGQSSPGPGVCMCLGLECWGHLALCPRGSPRWKGSSLLLCVHGEATAPLRGAGRVPLGCVCTEKGHGEVHAAALHARVTEDSPAAGSKWAGTGRSLSQASVSPCSSSLDTSPSTPAFPKPSQPRPLCCRCSGGGTQGSLGACKGLAARLGSCLHADGTGYSQPRGAGAVLSQGPGAWPAPLHPRTKPLTPRGTPKRDGAPPRIQTTACQLRYAVL